MNLRIMLKLLKLVIEAVDEELFEEVSHTDPGISCQKSIVFTKYSFSVFKLEVFFGVRSSIF